MGDRVFCKCGSSFDNEYRLKLHTDRVHIDRGEHWCELCDLFFKVYSTLIEHRTVMHLDKSSHKCKEKDCVKSYKTLAKLKEHHTTAHTEELPFKCERCDKRFGRIYGLTVHMKIHTGDKRFRCEECDISFIMSSGFFRHNRSKHSMESLYACAVCDKRFKRDEHRRLHEKVHLEVKPFVCLKCGDGFTQKVALSYHERVHVGERPYTCTECDTSYTCASTLKAHVRRWHTYEGQARQKKHEQRFCRALIAAGYTEVSLGDASPHPGTFVREKVIDFKCAEVWKKRSHARLDFVICPKNSHGVLVFAEVDEGQHCYGFDNGVGYSCDARRMRAVMSSIMLSEGDDNNQIIWLRYNPNAYKIGGILCKKRVKDKEAEIIEWLDSPNLKSNNMKIVYAFYDEDSNRNLRVVSDPEYPSDFIEVVEKLPRRVID